MSDTDLVESVKELIERYRQELDDKETEIALLTAQVRLLENHLLTVKELVPLPTNTENTLIIL